MTLPASNPSKRPQGEARDLALEALIAYGLIARKWNQPDDEHTRFQLRAVLDEALAELFMPCPVCGDRGEVPATPGQPSDGPMPCPRCSKPRPDYDPRIDYPERYTDGPV
jgi:hypothetical protein